MLIYCSGMTHKVARHEPEAWIVNLSILGNRKFTSGSVGLDTIVPGAAERQSPVGDVCNKVSTPPGRTRLRTRPQTIGAHSAARSVTSASVRSICLRCLTSCWATNRAH